MKRFITALLALLVLLSLFGCNKATSPRDAVDRFASAMNQNNFRSAFAYVADYDSFGFTDKTEDIIKAVASSMRVEFINESVGSTSATVDVKVTTVDLREVYMNAAAKVIPEFYQAAVSGQTISESVVGDRMIEEIAAQAADSYAPTVTTQLSLYLTKTDDGKWQIRLDTNAYYAITGYLDEANNLVTTGMIINAISANGGSNQNAVVPAITPDDSNEVSSSDAASDTPAEAGGDSEDGEG